MDDYLAKPIRPERVFMRYSKNGFPPPRQTRHPLHIRPPSRGGPYVFDPDGGPMANLGSPDLFARMVNQFVRDAIASCQYPGISLRLNNPEQLTQLHGLKGICRNMGPTLAELPAPLSANARTVSRQYSSDHFIHSNGHHAHGLKREPVRQITHDDDSFHALRLLNTWINQDAP